MRGNQLEVSNGIARIGGKSYALNKINCVEIKSVKRFQGAVVLAFMLGLIGLPLVLTGFAAGQPVMGVLGLVLAVCAVLAFRSRNIFEHTLVLTTSSRDVAALRSRDWDLVNGLREQIEQGMVSS